MVLRDLRVAAALKQVAEVAILDGPEVLRDLSVAATLKQITILLLFRLL